MTPVTTARPLTASHTTGWVGWIHWELWLLPEGLLRVRSILWQTFARQNRRTVPDEPVVPIREALESWRVSGATK